MEYAVLVPKMGMMRRVLPGLSIAQGLLVLAAFPMVTFAYHEQAAFLGPSCLSEPVSKPSFTPVSYTAGPIRSVWNDGYYNDPTGIVEQPQPRVTDPVRCELIYVLYWDALVPHIPQWSHIRTEPVVSSVLP